MADNRPWRGDSARASALVLIVMALALCSGLSWPKALGVAAVTAYIHHRRGDGVAAVAAALCAILVSTCTLGGQS